ncbi:class F sortase [Actinomadura sp. HBU206391]|uniref:class F sortase n=1 Tax=Actinomadura sp. HBU206391 TaxID=2731692 RepID=UPI0016505237|nr:class F sortase [Actinomadura sp. HBU206391]MBC6457539.1 class F sortase [Actinomadura sp. HBU206391]
MPGPSARGRALLVTAAVLGLTGAFTLGLGLRGTPGPPQPPAWAATARPVDHTPAVLGRSAPEQISIPSIGLRARLTSLYLGPDGSLSAPPAGRPGLAGWYAQGPAPGEPGPAVILGHVDTRDGPAIFYDLGRLRPGDTVEVTRRDRAVVVFRIESIEQVPKDRFPTNKVYDPLDYAGLRLITCGGRFDRAGKSYTHNVIAYAHQTAIR